MHDAVDGWGHDPAESEYLAPRGLRLHPPE
jgi:hypothetical protein